MRAGGEQGYRYTTAETYRERKVQTLCCHALARRFKCDDRSSKRDPNERSKRATKRMANNPDIRIRVHHRDVVIQVLFP
jgi:hypothetical protein